MEEFCVSYNFCASLANTASLPRPVPHGAVIPCPRSSPPPPARPLCTVSLSPPRSRIYPYPCFIASVRIAMEADEQAEPPEASIPRLDLCASDLVLLLRRDADPNAGLSHQIGRLPSFVPQLDPQGVEEPRRCSGPSCYKPAMHHTSRRGSWCWRLHLRSWSTRRPRPRHGARAPGRGARADH